MLGLGISSLAGPIAIGQGRARHLPDAFPRAAVAGLILGAFGLLMPAAQVASSLMMLGSQPVMDGGNLTPIECDCSQPTASPAFEIRLDALSSDGERFEAPSGEQILLEPVPLLVLADFMSLQPLAAEQGPLQLAFQLRPDAAQRFTTRAVPGRTLAILLDGDCIFYSAVIGPLDGSGWFAVSLTPAQACELRCAVVR